LRKDTAAQSNATREDS